MKKILIIGAGKSATVLIEYLLRKAAANQWELSIGDLDINLAEDKAKGHPNARCIHFDVHDNELRKQEIKRADLVISMLPARFHYEAAKECVAFGKHFLSASYVSDDVRKLDGDARKAGIIILKELGLDPGIDHMSAMEKLDELRAKKVDIHAFETFTGGLVAPESDNNPWNYKFTWNPRNVVLAGQGIVKFKHNGRYKFIPYHKLFTRYETLSIPGFGEFEGYPNRDSLQYRESYRLENVDTIYRGTLRRPGFCDAWDVFVQLGMTDDSYVMEDTESMTNRDFINSFLWYDRDKSVELKLAVALKLDFNSRELNKLKWIGIFDHTPIGLKNATPAQILQHILEKKLSLGPDDKDMIAMLHRYDYEENGKKYRLQSSMVVLGDDPAHTAMAKTVGLPLGIAACKILDGSINLKGVVIPTVPEIYSPVLKELKDSGIVFVDQLMPFEEVLGV